MTKNEKGPKDEWAEGYVKEVKYEICPYFQQPQLPCLLWLRKKVPEGTCLFADRRGEQVRCQRFDFAPHSTFCNTN